jgi:DNA-binding CsgD family transcriptional regulator
LANGLQSKELAVVINRSVPTVEMNIRRLYAKMSAKSRAHLVALAFSGQILTEKEVA